MLKGIINVLIVGTTLSCLSGIIVKRRRTTKELKRSADRQIADEQIEKAEISLRKNIEKVINNLQLNANSITEDELKEFAEEIIGECIEKAVTKKVEDFVNSLKVDKTITETLRNKIEECFSQDELYINIKPIISEKVENTFKYTYWLNDGISKVILSVINEDLKAIAGEIKKELPTMKDEILKDVTLKGVSEGINSKIKGTVIDSYLQFETKQAIRDCANKILYSLFENERTTLFNDDERQKLKEDFKEKIKEQLLPDAVSSKTDEIVEKAIGNEILSVLKTEDWKNINIAITDIRREALLLADCNNVIKELKAQNVSEYDYLIKYDKNKNIRIYVVAKNPDGKTITSHGSLGKRTPFSVINKSYYEVRKNYTMNKGYRSFIEPTVFEKEIVWFREEIKKSLNKK